MFRFKFLGRVVKIIDLVYITHSKQFHMGLVLSLKHKNTPYPHQVLNLIVALNILVNSIFL